jgi:LysM repeat protein
LRLPRFAYRCFLGAGSLARRRAFLVARLVRFYARVVVGNFRFVFIKGLFMRRSLGSCFRPRYLGASVVTSLATTLCAGALFVGPSLAPVYAAPTVGGDENGPQVQILQPGYQDVLKGKTKILIAVKARKFNPQSVEMFIDDKPATSGPIALGALPSAAFDWDTKLFADGPHKLTVRVTDTQGFRGWAEVNIYINNDRKIDSLPPSLQWQNLAPYQQLSGKAQIQLQAVDNFGVKWIIVSVNPASEPNKKPALRSWLLNRPPYIVNFDTTVVPDGLYQLSAKAWDSFEQEGNANPLSFGIVNNAINATTVGEMLRGMRQIKNSSTTIAPKPKAATRFTVDPEETQISSGNYGSGRAEVAQSGQPALKSTSPAELLIQRGSATQLQPAAPGLVTRQGSQKPKPRGENAKTVVEIARNSEVAAGAVPEIALPRLSASRTVNGVASASSQKLSHQKESAGATNENSRTRVARLAAPTSELRAVESPELRVDNAQMSTVVGEDLSVSRAASALVEAEAMPRLDVARAAIPAGGEREFEITASQNPEAEKPVWSQEDGPDSTRLAQSAPLKVEAPSMVLEGRASAPDTLVARAEVAPELGGPVLSSPVVPFSSRVAERVTPTLESVETEPSRVATLPLGSERMLSDSAVFNTPFAELPQISALPAAPETRASTRFPVSGQKAASTIARNAKAAVPALGKPTRVAALPRTSKSAQNAAITAISVSPLEVKTSSAIPAFHTVARATNLRAVAARYGLPVEVVAACNAWTSDKILLGGERVKLPQQLEVAYQGVPVRGDAPSMLVGGTGVTAFRFMFEQAGGKLVWDAKKQRVIAKKGASEVVLTIGSKKAKVGDQNVMMELAAFLFEGRTMIPVRFFEEGLKAQVEWDPQTGRLVVAMAG